MKTFICLSLIVALALAGPFPVGENFSTGFIPLDSASDDKLFYWLFDSRNAPKTDPLVLWLTGGPGCSSELACLKENGPYRMDFGASEPRILKEGWNDKANLLFVDQPIGTGFSTGKIEDYCTSEDCVAKDFFIFFKGFLNKFPQFKNRPFFITGESYAGHYVPAISAYLKAQQTRQPSLGFNLVSSAIGNGLTDPYNQYPAYADFALKNKLIDEREYESMHSDLMECQRLIGEGSEQALNTCLEASNKAEQYFEWRHFYRFNVYNYKTRCEGQLCYNFDNVNEFLNREETLKTLGVFSEGKQWESCNMQVHQKMMGDWMNDLAPKIRYLLTNGVHILIYAGDLDYICNYMGNKAWTLALDWAYKTEFNNASDQPWPTEDGSLSLSRNYGNVQYKKGDYGLLRQYKNFSFLQVFEAGHMVPMDQPQAAIVMLEEFFHAIVANQNKNLRQQ